MIGGQSVGHQDQASELNGSANTKARGTTDGMQAIGRDERTGIYF